MHPHHQFLVLCLVCTAISASSPDNSLNLLRKVYDQCAPKEEVFKCLKIQSLKVIDRALHSKALNIVDGITLVSSHRGARKFQDSPPLNESKLNELGSQEIDGMIVDSATRFVDSHVLQVDIPKLVEEGRRKKHKGHHHAALLWALGIKGSFLAMAYNGIAVMAGTALIVGKMALLLSAILGLKKLVSSGHEKTTFEIVKVPKYSESHSHSTSYEDEGHYQRSFNSPEEISRRIYRRHVPNM